jgi:hypothetical protein
LIIADEQRPGKIMSGVIIATVLRDMGYKIKLFMGNVDEASMRALQILCNMPVTLLDPTLCGGRSNLRWLFQQAASPDCLNIVLTNLGGRWTEDSPFRVPKECFSLAEWLECEVVPVVYSDMSSTLTVRTLNEIMSQFLRNAKVLIRSFMFRSILNDREFELVDREAVRQFSSISAGSIPKLLERDAPLITDLCADETNHAVFPLRSAALRLKCMPRQIEWPLFSALAKIAPEWIRQPRLCKPITDSGKVNIAVVRHPALTLGGDGTEHLMRALGCNVVDVSLDGSISHSVPIHGVFLPHGLAYMALPKFFGNIYLKTMFNRASNGSSFLLAEGGSSPLLGHKIILPPGQGGGGSGRGFGILPFDSAYKASAFGPPQKLVASNMRVNPFISGSQEYVWGYSSASLSLTGNGPDDECWETSETLDGKRYGFDGWSKGRILASSMRLEPWSAPESFRRWLEG